MTSELFLPRVTAAAAFLGGRIRRTPVEQSPNLGASVWLKLESLQITGSFKVRGAWWRLHNATEAERKTGVASCSAGNHGKGLALAAREEGIRATIFVPKSVDQAKYKGMLAYGADVRRSEFDGYDETEAWAKAEATRLGMPFISAFDDYDVMAGNGGTLAMECIEQLPGIRNYVVPVGGGGLAAGFATVLKDKFPQSVLIGCQHELSPALKLSLDRGSAVTQLPAVETIASGVEGGIGALTFPMLQHRIDGVVLVNEEEIREAVRWMIREHQYLIEPTSAVTLAACLNGRVQLNEPTCVLLCGRNVSAELLKKIM